MKLTTVEGKHYRAFHSACEVGDRVDLAHLLQAGESAGTDELWENNEADEEVLVREAIQSAAELRAVSWAALRLSSTNRRGQHDGEVASCGICGKQLHAGDELVMVPVSVGPQV